MQIISTLKLLKILLFWEIIEEQNPCMLYADYAPERVYAAEEKAAAQAVWNDLYDEYYLLENDAMTKAVLRESFENMRMLSVINHLTECLSFLMMVCNLSASMTDETLDEVVQLTYSAIVKAEPRVNIKYFESVQKNIDITNRVLESLKNSYAIKHPRNEKDIAKQKKNVYELVAKVGVALGGVQLNVENMNVPEWMAYKKIAIARSKPTVTEASKKNG